MPPSAIDSAAQRAHDVCRLHGTSKTIGSIVRGFKIGVTKWMRQHTEVYEVWQRNFYKRIIRNERHPDELFSGHA